MLVGDFNARTGHKPDFVPTDERLIDDLEVETIIPVVLHDGTDLFSDPVERVSSDDKCNNYGNRLLDWTCCIYLMEEWEMILVLGFQHQEVTVLLIM